ncbi:MAG: anhydro-N-acetylmuramic acid kinase [Gammaproteobacteria bacterium RIFCSPHIGHO2_12_FULL_36_30]|nr:MAG: anhydro-N-acetylmuramic acid kinase [Gammaproteobacteria bacterium RIFCSPHIGHO2_12_FULL_36_30]
MSGTSMDGIDAALVSFDNNQTNLIDTVSIHIPEKIKSALKILSHGENINIKLIGETDTQMGNLFADVVLALLKKTNSDAKNIVAIGSHGQTIYHHPNSENPFTMQIGDANIIAARTKITTVADFRRRDIAHGGQGAPLVPKFHDYLFRNRTADQFVVNIGGIANITYLPVEQNKNIIGFDTGPGNTLLDLWCEKNCNKSFDQNGEWARSGKSNADLLDIFLDDDYFKKSFPKSTGKEYFNLTWLEKKLSASKKNISPQDIQNTLTELTATTIVTAVFHTPTPTIYICGGGAFNLFLMERLHANLPNTTIHTTEKIGINPKWMEAIAFAWLAKQTLEKKSGNCISVTGAKEECILGGIYC